MDVYGITSYGGRAKKLLIGKKMLEGTVYSDDFVHLHYDFIQALAVAFCFHTGARAALGRAHIRVRNHKANVRNHHNGR